MAGKEQENLMYAFSIAIGMRGHSGRKMPYSEIRAAAMDVYKMASQPDAPFDETIFKDTLQEFVDWKYFVVEGDSYSMSDKFSRRLKEEVEPLHARNLNIALGMLAFENIEADGKAN